MINNEQVDIEQASGFAIVSGSNLEKSMWREFDRGIFDSRRFFNFIITNQDRLLFVGEIEPLSKLEPIEG